MNGARSATAIAALGAVLVLVSGTSPALAAGSWTVVPAPPTGQNAHLVAATAVSASDAWAVGSQNASANGLGAKAVIDNWNGATWTQVPVTAPASTTFLTAVSASSATDAWAIGWTEAQRYHLVPLALRWNGTTWSQAATGATALPQDTYMVGAADVNSADAYAIGDNSAFASGYLEQWNGTAWIKVTLPQPSNTGYPTTLNAIAASGPNDVWIVGSYMVQVSATNLRYETYSLHWNGTTWSVVPMPQVAGSDALLAYGFNSIAVDGPDDVWAVGGSGDNVLGIGGTASNTLIEHWNGATWSIVPSPSPGTNADLTGVATVNAANDIWAVGYDTPAGATAPQTLTLNWNGTAWTTVASPDGTGPNVLDAVSAVPGTAGVWAVGSNGASGSLNPLVLQGG